MTMHTQIQTTPNDLQVLIEDYKSRYESMTWKERTWLEKRMWDVTPSEFRNRLGDAYTGRGGGPRARFLAGAIGFGAPNDYELRFTLLQAYTHGEPLWQRLDQGLSVYTALRILRDARKLGDREKMPLIDAVNRLLHEYETGGDIRMSANGKSFRQKTIKVMPSPEEAVASEGAGPKDLTDPHTFWGHLRQVVAEHLGSRLKDVEPLLADRIWRELEVDLKALVQETGEKIRRAAKQGREDILLRSDISPAKVRKACQTLILDPPKTGKPVDIKLAKSQKKKLVRTYHPDAHQGDETTRPLYEAVLAAFTTIEAYNESLLGTGTGDSHGGNFNGTP